jgi:polyisoprenoid-binding protein YceI
MSVLSNLPAGKYVVDGSHSRIGFSARHAVVTKVRGSFNAFDASAEIANGAASLNVSIDVNSIDTRNGDRDGHLKSPDFFDAANFPAITFKSSSVSATDSAITVNGELTIKDVTKPLAIELDYTGTATDPFGNARYGFEGSTSINREDFGLTWNAMLEAGGVLVSQKIELEFEISAIHQA